MTDDVKINADVWKQLYSKGHNDLVYPNEYFVRSCHHYLKDKSIKNVLDYGFGTGANLIHLAKNNYVMSGCEISQHALDKTKSRLDSLHLSADLFCIEAEQELPWDDNYFDCVIAWQVLYYNNWVSWAKAVKELERVLKPGGIFLCCTAAPGDISQEMSSSLGNGIYRSNVTEQNGCILLIPDKSQLAACFPDRNLDVGEFSYTFAGRNGRHWVIKYNNE